MKKTIDAWFLKLSVLPLVLGLFTGCATQETQFISPEVAAKVRKVAVYEEISTPTSLSTPLRGGGIIGVAVGLAVQAKAQNGFTREVSAKLDFQKFAEETTRELFLTAIGKHAGWTLTPTNEVENADAMFVIDVESIGVADPPPALFPSFKDIGSPYRPVVTIRATLIAKPPFEIVRGKSGLQTTDPATHPILFVQVGRATNQDAKKGYSSSSLTDNAESFKAAFREAIEIAVQRLADGWTPESPENAARRRSQSLVEN